MRNFKSVAIATTLSLLLVPTLQSINLNAEETTSTYEQKAQEAGRTEEQLQEYQSTTLKSSKTTHTNASAVETAQSYAFANMSKLELKDQLMYEGFTSSQAQYGVDNCGANWKANALATAKVYKAKPFYMNGTEVYDQLIYEKFTTSEAHYAVDTLFTETWSNSGTVKKNVTGKTHGKNATYIEDYQQTQKSSNGRTRTIRTDYKKGTYDANGHTKTWENWNYNSNGTWTTKTVTTYKWNPVTKKEVVYKVTKYQNGKGVTSNKVTPTTWSTKKTYTVKSGKSRGKNATYIEDYKKDQVSNFGSKRTIRYDYKKGTYDSKGHTKTWENWDYNSSGKFTAKKLTKYSYINNKERVINNDNRVYKTPGNSKSSVHTYYKNTKYYSNGKVKSFSTYSYYSGSNQANKNVYNEFYDNGKMKYAKDTYYYSSGKTKEIRSNSYNSKGTKTKSYNKKVNSSGKTTYEKTTDYTKKSSSNSSLPKSFNGLKSINPSPCDTSGKRQANVKASIGYGSRKYYSRTNSKSQLVEVYAKDIVLQNDHTEKVKSNGRYCNDEAKVKGTEKPNLDEGHAIADSLGGESNAYNITPEASKLNRSGQQYKMESEIRSYENKHKQVTNFHMYIYYPNTSTQTPNKYKVTYNVEGKQKLWQFNNK